MSSSKNPIEVIPKEIFLKLIALLSSKDVAFASSTSKDWKEVIESDSTLFTQAEIKPFRFYIQALQDDLELDDIELYHEEMKLKAVNHLVRFVRLSRQRLRKVHIDLDLLLDYGVKTVKGDYTHDYPMRDVLTNLFLCKDSLKTVSFKLPVLSLFMEESEHSLPLVALDVIALLNVIKEHLPNSSNIAISATTYLNLVSTSTSKTFSLLHCSRELEEDETEDILTSEEDHFFFPNDHLMIQEIQDFTRNGFLKVKPERARPLSDLTLAHLSRAKESIKEIEVFGSGLDVTEAWWTHIISQAPNLSSLLLNVSQDSLEINLNASLPVVSKLQKLRLICHEVLTLNWNQHFSKWIGKQLEYLNMAWKSNAGLGLGRFSIDLDSFIKFLVSCKETLQDIRLEGMGISYLSSDLDLSRLSFNNIWQLVIISNVATIKLFTALNYSSLQRLAFEAIQDEGDVRLPYRDIIQLIRRCGHTLTFFQLRESTFSSEIVNENQEQDQDELLAIPSLHNDLISTPLSLVNVKDLRLQIHFKALEALCSIEFPQLEALQIQSIRAQEVGQLPHREILKLLRSCRKTLRKINLSEREAREGQVDQEEESVSVKDEFSMEEVTSLTIYLEDSNSYSFYSSLNYPKLKVSNLYITWDFRHLEPRFLSAE